MLFNHKRASSILVVFKWLRPLTHNCRNSDIFNNDHLHGIRNSVFSVCSFAYLLCVHTVFEKKLSFLSFIVLLTRTIIPHPFTKIAVLND